MGSADVTVNADSGERDDGVHLFSVGGTVPQGLGRPEPACNTRGYGVVAAKRAPLGVASWNRKAHEGNRKGMLPLRFASCALVPCFTIQMRLQRAKS